MGKVTIIHEEPLGCQSTTSKEFEANGLEDIVEEFRLFLNGVGYSVKEIDYKTFNFKAQD